MSIEDHEGHEAMLAAIIDSSDDAIISKNLDGIITSWNKSAERIFEYKSEEVIGKHISILIPEERLAEENMILSNLRAGRRVEHFETVRRTKTGNNIHISLTVSPIKGSSGIIIGASKIARDISKQKESQEMLLQYAERLELINNIGRTIVSELDAEVILQKVTDATTKISGAAFGAFFYNKIDSKGKNYMLVKLSGASMEAFEKFGMPRNTAVFSKTFNGEGIYRSDDITEDARYGKNTPHQGMPEGHLPVVSYMAVPVVSQTGIVVGGLFFGHPKKAVFKQEHEALVTAIATQAAIALDNAKLYEEVTQLNLQKDEFIGFASHELKTPLTTAMGYLQLIEQEPGLTTQFIPKMTKQMTRLSTIIADLLDISRIQAGRLDLHFKHSRLKSLIKNSIEALGPNEDTHSIRCELPADDILLMIDEQKMEQVLVNLLTNAIKYSPNAKEVILTAMQLGDQLQISIKDFGEGIPEEHMDRIFKRFYRVPQAGNNAEGLGLGLYISQGIVEAHAGKIWAESKIGDGATFHVLFPVERIRP
ncbi:MAG: PAS domain S-box protein [Chitinophagaceae bacterium]|nr:MAG: PAS domain S-box protein [Chitinophagaceae bacterium]